MQEVFMHYT